MSYPPEPPCCVYRAYDADGVALYVGQTQDLEQRMKSHRTVIWFDQIARLEHDWYATRTEAREFEAFWIRELRPVFNTQNVGLTMKDSEARAKAYVLRTQGRACAHCNGTGVDALAPPSTPTWSHRPGEVVRLAIDLSPRAPAEFQANYEARCAEFFAAHGVADAAEFWDAVVFAAEVRWAAEDAESAA